METGPMFWLILVTLGVAVLGIAMAMANSRNKKRTPLERSVTDAATKQQYRDEDRASH